jgi:hypothetical protein
MFPFQPGQSYSDIVKFHRDDNDKNPNVWYNPNEKSKDKVIFDKNIAYNTLFSVNDFAEAIDPHKERASIQDKLREYCDDWLLEGGKKYVITNEGLGKSTTILKLGAKYDFIFICHSRDRIKEVSAYLLNNRIDYEVIISNSEILEKHNLDDIAIEYKTLKAQDDDISFIAFVKDNISSPTMRSNILSDYNENLKKLKTNNCIRLVTSSKLKYEIYKEDKDGILEDKWYIHQYFIFDEFVLDEWATCMEPEEEEYIFSEPTIWNKKNKFISLSENEFNFSTLLNMCQNVLILTTERGLIEALLYDSDYMEMVHYDTSVNLLENNYSLPIVKFEKKVFDDTVKYFISNTTAKTLRNDIILQSQELFKKKLYVISNGTIESDASHIAVKGMNNLTKTDTLIIGTLRTEIEDNILYYSASKFFNKFQQHHSKEKTRYYIQQIQLEAQVSQSIGRNSGFRSNGSETYVILPLLKPNSVRTLKPYNINYITHKVKRMYVDKTKGCTIL